MKRSATELCFLIQGRGSFSVFPSLLFRSYPNIACSVFGVGITLDATTTGVDVYGDLSYTGSLIPSSDKRLKKDIKEVNSKKAVELVKYIKPKTYHFIDDRQQGKSCVGFIANDCMETKKMPDEWQNVVKEGKDGYLRFDYTTCVPILWSALQYALEKIDNIEKEKDELFDLVKSLKKEMTTTKSEITKIKNKMKGQDKSDSD